MCQGENSSFRPNFHIFLHNSVTHEYIFLPKKIWNFFRKSSHPSVDDAHTPLIEGEALGEDPEIDVDLRASSEENVVVEFENI